MEIIKEKNSRAGIIGTVLVHLLLLLMFLSFGMPYQDPAPENEGAMMINFGTSDSGSGDEQPTEPESSASENANPTENSAAEENILTQDNIEAVEVNSSPIPKDIEPTPTPKEEPVVSENLSNALNALNNSESTSSQGETDGAGDQGDPNGDPNSNGTSTSGGSGIGFDLGGRGKVSFKKPENPTQEDGKVVVEIWVNREGKVLRAKTGARGSTTTNPILQKKAEEAAYKARFKKDENAPFEQKGTMTFVFILN
ncbi:TonB family protein [Vicingaceae bacterium]|jgi:periplasmic protein TonB|nr:TonB family protein [Vicingaceae bacterium]